MTSPGQAARKNGRPLRPQSITRSEFCELRTAIEQRLAPQFGELATLVFEALVLKRGAFHIRHLEWCTAADAEDVVWPVVCASSNRGLAGEDAWVFELGDAIVRLVISRDGMVKASVAAAAPEALDTAERELQALIPREVPTGLKEEIGSLTVTFWCYGVPACTRRRLPTLPWNAIERNYTEPTRRALTPLFEDPNGRNPGQLVLWHGEPGTGKTYAIRGLAHAWRSWCDIHYVTDPEVFFGPTASYMRDVLLDSDGYYGPDFGDQHLEREDSAERWRLLVLEDTGELLGVDAKVDTGQGLSRLLNVVDGFLGQGLKLLILITTNEPLARLHPAVVRPGRCAAVVEFERFSPSEGNQWLLDHGSDASTETALTLAEMYSLLAGNRPDRPRRTVGFG